MEYDLYIHSVLSANHINSEEGFLIEMNIGLIKLLRRC